MWKIGQDKGPESFTDRVRIVCWYAFLLILGVVLITFTVYRFSEVKSIITSLSRSITGVFVGLVIAYLMEPVCSFIERVFQKVFRYTKKGNTAAKWLGIVGGMVFGVGLVIALIWLIIPGVIDSISRLITDLPGYVAKAQGWIQQLQHGSPETKEAINQIITRVTDVFENWMKTTVSRDITNLISVVTTGIIDVIKFVVNFFVGVVIAVYVLRDKRKAGGQAKKVIFGIFPAKAADSILETVRQGDRIFGGFIHGKVLDSLIIGILAFIGCSIMQIPYTLLISVIIGFTNIIPFFGPFLGAAPSALLILLVDPLKAFYFIIFIIILQQIDGNIIGPRLVGNNTGINEFWVTFSLLLFGGIFGFFGMVIGVPLFAVIYYLVVRFLNARLRKKGMPILAESYTKVGESAEARNLHESYKPEDFVELSAGDYKAYVSPRKGGQMLGLSYENMKILHEPASEADFNQNSTWYGMPVLFPPNRIDRGSFSVGDRTYRFPINEPDRNNSLHGFLQNAVWRVISQKENAITMRITADERTDFYPVFPVKFTAELEYKLTKKGLMQKISISNQDTVPLPLGLGFHSAFDVDEDSLVWLSVDQRIELNQRMLPSGTVRDLNMLEAPLRKEGLRPDAFPMDDHYTVKPLMEGEKPFHGAVISRGDYLVKYRVDDFFKHWMIWNNEASGDFICLEPQNWRINAPNLVESLGDESGFEVLYPGETRSATSALWVEPNG